MTKARIAVAGAGAIGRAHIARIVSSPRATLAGVADPGPSAAEFCAARGIRHFTAVDAMLDGIKPDGVIIASPNAHHRANAIAAIERGIPVLIEKPIADTIDDAQAIAEVSERCGVAVLVGHHRRHNPILQRAREAVQGGKLGRLVTVTAIATMLKPDAYFDVAWRREPGGGPVLINAIHAIDDLRFVCGEIAGVQAMASRAIRGHAVEDTAVVTLRFSNGALGTLSLSDTAAAPWSWELTSAENSAYPPNADQDCYLIAGTEGSLAVPSMRTWCYDGYDDGRRGWTEPMNTSVLTTDAADPLVRQLAHFCDVLTSPAAPLITARDALRTLHVTLSIHAAASTGGMIALD